VDPILDLKLDCERLDDAKYRQSERKVILHNVQLEDGPSKADGTRIARNEVIEAFELLDDPQVCDYLKRVHRSAWVLELWSRGCAKIDGSEQGRYEWKNLAKHPAHRRFEESWAKQWRSAIGDALWTPVSPATFALLVECCEEDRSMAPRCYEEVTGTATKLHATAKELKQAVDERCVAPDDRRFNDFWETAGSYRLLGLLPEDFNSLKRDCALALHHLSLSLQKVDPGANQRAALAAATLARDITKALEIGSFYQEELDRLRRQQSNHSQAPAAAPKERSTVTKDLEPVRQREVFLKSDEARLVAIAIAGGVVLWFSWFIGLGDYGTGGNGHRTTQGWDADKDQRPLAAAQSPPEPETGYVIEDATTGLVIGRVPVECPPEKLHPLRLATSEVEKATVGAQSQYQATDAQQETEEAKYGSVADTLSHPPDKIELAKWRTWTTADGRYKAEAKFVTFVAGTVTLEKKDGNTVDVKLDILCSEDRDFVTQQKWRWAARKEDDPPLFLAKNETPSPLPASDPAAGGVRRIVMRAWAHVEAGDYDSGIADLTEAVRLDPTEASTYWVRGSAYYAKRDYGSAIADLTEAIRLDPTVAVAYSSRGRAYCGKGDYDRAIADFTEAIRLDPTDAFGYCGRGLAYSDKRDYDRAIADFTDAIRLDPKDADAYWFRGMTYDSKGDYDAAIADYTQAIRLDPKYADAFWGRGMAYNGKGDHDRAIADFTEAIRLDPTDASAYRWRGMAYQAKGQRAAAERDFAQAKRLGCKLQPPVATVDGGAELDTKVGARSQGTVDWGALLDAELGRSKPVRRAPVSPQPERPSVRPRK